jgi:phenylalanyl-tRNA synthetase beta subunit
MAAKRLDRPGRPYGYGSDGEPSFETIVRHFKARNPPRTVSQAKEELEQFLKLPLSEDELDEIVGKLRCDYYPPGGGITFRQSLEAVLKILKEPLERA